MVNMALNPFMFLKMKNLIIALFLFGSFMSIGQTSLNEYKYIIVPKKFDGFRNENEHLTSTTIKYLLTQKEYNVVYDDALPNDLNSNRCLGLTTVLDDTSSMFSTKLVLHLKDCNGAIVMTTMEGKSKDKEYKAAYGEAIRQAFKSFDMINYKYKPKNAASDAVSISFKNDVKKLDKAKKVAKNETKKGVVVQEATTERQTYEDKSPVESDYKKAKPKKIIDQVATTEEQSYKSTEPVTSEIKQNSENSVPFSAKKAYGVLYAQELPNGYQLVDSTPKIKLVIYKTSIADYYLAKSEDLNGLVYSKNGKWYFEFYVEKELMVEELNIKF